MTSLSDLSFAEKLLFLKEYRLLFYTLGITFFIVMVGLGILLYLAQKGGSKNE